MYQQITKPEMHRVLHRVNLTSNRTRQCLSVFSVPISIFLLEFAKPNCFYLRHVQLHD